MGLYKWNGNMIPRASVGDEQNYLSDLKQQFTELLSKIKDVLPFAEFSYEDRKLEGEPEKIYSDVIEIQKSAIKSLEELIHSINDSISPGQNLPGLVKMTKELLEYYGYLSKYFTPIKKQVKQYYIDNGYLESGGKITDKGYSVGIQTVERVDADGNPFTQTVFSEQAKQLVLPYIPQFKQNVNNNGGPPESTKSYIKGYSPALGKEIAFQRIYSGHEFMDNEAEKLLRGEEITIVCSTWSGKTYQATGKLKYSEDKIIYGKHYSYYRFVAE